jgi:hypothetical protein
MLSLLGVALKKAQTTGTTAARRAWPKLLRVVTRSDYGKKM